MTVATTEKDLIALIAAAGADESGLDEVIARIGAGQVAAFVVDEMVRHAGPFTLSPAVAGEISVRFRFRWRAGVADRFVVHDPSGTRHREAHDTEPHATVAQDLSEVVRGLFGTGAPAATRTITWRDKDDLSAAVLTGVVVHLVRRLLDRVDITEPGGLARIAVECCSDKWGQHQYAQHYERHFAPLRAQPLSVLELGIGGYGDTRLAGASLRMWKRYFKRAMVYGIDIFDTSVIQEQRIVPFQADQSDAGALRRIADRIGALDIVIDDGSHVNQHVITSFGALFPRLRPGGLYVIEDLQTSYWPSFGGDSRRRDDPATSMGFLKQLLDGLNHEEILAEGDRPAQPWDTEIKAIHFYHNMAVIEKGLNQEGTAPSWVPRRNQDGPVSPSA